MVDFAFFVELHRKGSDRSVRSRLVFISHCTVGRSKSVSNNARGYVLFDNKLNKYLPNIQIIGGTVKTDSYLFYFFLILTSRHSLCWLWKYMTFKWYFLCLLQSWSSMELFLYKDLYSVHDPPFITHKYVDWIKIQRSDFSFIVYYQPQYLVFLKKLNYQHRFIIGDTHSEKKITVPRD